MRMEQIHVDDDIRPLDSSAAADELTDISIKNFTASMATASDVEDSILVQRRGVKSNNSSCQIST